MAFKCSLCPKEFKLKHQLHRHLASVHVSEGDHVCKTCQRSFSRRDALSRHQRKHEIDEIIHTCNVCEKVFLRKDNLTRHVKTHDNNNRRRQGPKISSPNPHFQGTIVKDKHERYVEPEKFHSFISSVRNIIYLFLHITVTFLVFLWPKNSYHYYSGSLSP